MFMSKERETEKATPERGVRRRRQRSCCVCLGVRVLTR